MVMGDPSAAPKDFLPGKALSSCVSSDSMPTRRFVKYTFLKVDPAWRRLDDDRRAAGKREFIAAREDFADGHLLRAFSLVGTRGDADVMLLSQAETLERIHEFHVVLGQSG